MNNLENNQTVIEVLKEYIEKNTSKLKLNSDESSREARFVDFENFKVVTIEDNLYEITSNFNFQVDVYLKDETAGECESGWIAENIDGKFHMKIQFENNEENLVKVLEFKEYF